MQIDICFYWTLLRRMHLQSALIQVSIREIYKDINRDVVSTEIGVWDEWGLTMEAENREQLSDDGRSDSATPAMRHLSRTRYDGRQNLKGLHIRVCSIDVSTQSYSPYVRRCRILVNDFWIICTSMPTYGHWAVWARFFYLTFPFKDVSHIYNVSHFPIMLDLVATLFKEVRPGSMLHIILFSCDPKLSYV